MGLRSEGQPGQLVAVLPAHDEESTIGAALASLTAQTRPPDRILVVADNCTDDTAAVAAGHGAEVMASQGNTCKKAGALNQGLRRLMPHLGSGDHVMIMDADSMIAPDWIENAVKALAQSGIGAVGGVFYGQPGSGLVGLLQRMEYVRYARQLARRSGSRAFVLTGTATLTTAGVLREVAAARAGGLVGGGQEGLDVYYHESNITEDSELTMAIKHLGHECVSPMDCWVSTEVMPTWRQLWVQRVRWQRGALDNLRAYGITRVTTPYAARQAWNLAEMLVLAGYLGLSAWTAVDGTLRFTPFWLTIGGIFVAERVVSARKAGPAAVLIAATMVVEMGYAIFKHAVNVKCLIDIGRGRSAAWS